MLRFQLGVTVSEMSTSESRWDGLEKTQESRRRCLDMYGGKMLGILKDAEDRTARKEETGKAKKEVYRCGERVVYVTEED